MSMFGGCDDWRGEIGFTRPDPPVKGFGAAELDLERTMLVVRLIVDCCGWA